MCWFLAKPSEIVSRCDDPATEGVVPQAIDNHTWGERVALAKHVLRELAATTSRLVGLARERF